MCMPICSCAYMCGCLRPEEGVLILETELQSFASAVQTLNAEASLVSTFFFSYFVLAVLKKSSS